MILREQENVFLFELGLFVPAVLKCLFSDIFLQTYFTHLEKSYPHLLGSCNFLAHGGAGGNGGIKWKLLTKKGIKKK